MAEFKAKVWRYQVSHHEYGSTIVESVGPESATAAACRRWDADWAQEAAYCHVVKLGTAAKPRCRRCHREYGEAGDPAALCPECVEIEARRARDLARFRPQRRDRRVEGRK